MLVIKILLFKIYSSIFCIRRTARRGLLSCHLFDGYVPWYKLPIFSQIDLLVLKIYPLKVFSKIVCIRRTARRGVSSCHLFDGYVLLIQGSNFQVDKLTCSRDIPTQSFLENRLYQKNRSRGGLIVPPLPWSCSPDTRFEFSGW